MSKAEHPLRKIIFDLTREDTRELQRVVARETQIPSIVSASVSADRGMVYHTADALAISQEAPVQVQAEIFHRALTNQISTLSRELEYPVGKKPENARVLHSQISKFQSMVAEVKPFLEG